MADKEINIIQMTAPVNGVEKDVYPITHADAVIGLQGDGVKDVQVNGTSVVEDGVANIPLVSTSAKGVCGVTGGLGVLANSSGFLYVDRSLDSDIANKTSVYKPITPRNLDYAVKTGITTNTISLTDEEKQAAQSWLGVSDLVGDIETLLSNI